MSMSWLFSIEAAADTDHQKSLAIAELNAATSPAQNSVASSPSTTHHNQQQQHQLQPTSPPPPLIMSTPTSTTMSTVAAPASPSSRHEAPVDWHKRWQLEKEKRMQMEAMVERLQMELETVPLYIERYHDERKRLKQKAAQKDQYLQQVVEQYHELEQECIRLQEALIQMKQAHGDSDSGVVLRNGDDRTQSIIGQMDEQLGSRDSNVVEELARTASADDVMEEYSGLHFYGCPDCQGPRLEV